MAPGKPSLPHESGDLFITDGGLETTLVFLEGYELPCFAAFDLLKDEAGYTALKEYYRRYLKIAKDFKAGFILESPTWRANPDWIEKTGYPKSALASINAKAIGLLVELKDEFESQPGPVLLSGCVGPRGDGYRVENSMTVRQAQDYHQKQIEVSSGAGVDMISAVTMNYVEEAIGIARAAGAIKLPVVISFTVETDGKLPTRMGLKQAIEGVDAGSEEVPLYYMINCAHPSHFSKELKTGLNEPWTKRIRGIRANASCKSHAQLDEATQLDRGNPRELAGENKELKAILPHLNVFGGCCATDEEHVLEIVKQLSSAY
jgi:S-methylmethionine-dependent homocysteine/selenocysteine methylase